MVNADTAIVEDNYSQLVEESAEVTESDSAAREDSKSAGRRVRFDDQSGGAEDTPGGNDSADEARSEGLGGAISPTTGRMIDDSNEDSSRYHYPVLEDSSRLNPVGAPWFLPGKPVEPSDGRPSRVRKAPERLRYDSFVVSESLLRDVVDIMDPATRRIVGNRMPYRPAAERSRASSSEADRRSERHHSSFIVAVDKAINQFGGKAVESLHKELSGLHQKKVFRQVLLKNLSEIQRRSVIRSKMFLKEKFLPDGTFDKLSSSPA
jgi:hypothetical protein